MMATQPALPDRPKKLQHELIEWNLHKSPWQSLFLTVSSFFQFLLEMK